MPDSPFLSLDWLSPEETYRQLAALRISWSERNFAYKTLRPYISPLLLEELLGAQAPSPHYQFCDGSVLFVDVSGFSALSDALSVEGRVGAERLTEEINRYFSELLKVAFLYDGKQVKFAGDAVLLYFGNQYHAERAAECALHIMRTMQGFGIVHTPRGDFPLSAHIGADSGQIFTARVGTEGRHEYLFSGPAVRQALQAGTLAASGEIVVGAGLATLLTAAEVEPKAEGYFALKAIVRQRPRNAMDAASPVVYRPSARQLADLASHLPFPLVQRMLTNREGADLIAGHRQVTILFLNFYDLDQLLAQETPEQLLQDLQNYFVMVEKTVSYYGGVISRCDLSESGERLLILFGAPVSHEHDAEYAIRCALALNANLAALSSPLHHRIGLSTGHVFCGNVGSQWHKEYTVMGNAANLAARLMNKAALGEIVANDLSLQQSSTQVVAEALAPVKVKGFIDPVQIHRIHGWQAQAKLSRERSVPDELVGRQEELALIRPLCAQALQGQGKALAISGPAGIGKSVLTLATMDLWEAAGGRVCQGTCEAYGERVPYLPWASLLGDLFDLKPGDSDLERQEKLARLVGELAPAWKDRLYLLNNLLFFSTTASDTIEIDPRLYQQQLYSFLATLLGAFADKTPLMLAISDLHWCDQASLGLIQHIARNIRNGRILLCFNYRSGERIQDVEGWCPNALALVLKELSQPACRALAIHLLGVKDISPQLLEQLWSSSEGNPLFLQEFLRYLEEHHYLSVDDQTNVCTTRRDLLESAPIPGSLEKIVISNLDRLDEGSRQALKMASVVGRSFPVTILDSFYPAQIEAIRQDLSDRHFLERQTLSEGEVYTFCRAQVQEIVYASLAFSQQRKMHCQVANVYEKEMGHELPKYYSLLAHHYDLGQDITKAFDYHFLAGDQARRTYANHEALYHYRRSLELLPSFKAPPAGQELWRLYKDYGRMCRFSGLYPEAEASYTQGLSLAQQSNCLSGQAETLIWISDLCQLKGDGKGLVEHSQQAADLSEQVNDAALLELSLEYVGGGMMFQGNLDAALQYFERCLKISRSADLPLGVMRSLNNVGLIQVNRREYGQAIAAFDEALASARSLRASFYIALLANNLGELYQELGNTPEAIQLHEEALSIARQHDIKDIHCDSLRNLGVDFALAGELEKGISLLRQALSLARQVKFHVVEAMILYNLADFLLQTAGSQEVESLLQDLVTLTNRLQIPPLLQRAHFLTALYSKARGQWPEAQAALQETLKLWLLEPVGHLGWQAYACQAEVWEKLGDPQAAQAAQNEASRLLAHILHTITDETLRTKFTRNPVVERILAGQA